MAEDLDQNYAKAGYHHGLGFGEEPAFVLVDFVQAYFEPGSPLYAGVEATLASALRGLEAARSAGAMRVMPQDDEIVISKQYPSALFGTSLADTLTAAKVDTIVMTKLATSGCVRATCVDAMSNGFISIIIRDSVGDRALQPHEANLFDMSAKDGDVVGDDETIAYFRRLENARPVPRE